MSENDHSECKALLGFLSEYIDGELSDDLCHEIEAHTSECDDCRIVVDTLRKTISLYHASAAEPPEISDETRSHLFKTLHLEDYIEHK